MKKKEQEIFQPFVTLEQLLAYRSEKPETWTRSELMNAFCRALERLGPAASGKAVAEFMGLNYIKLSGAVEIVCGLPVPAIKSAILEQRLSEIRAAHPYWTTDKLAKSVGLYDRSSMRRVLGPAAYKRLAAPLVGEEKRKIISDFERFVEQQRN